MRIKTILASALFATAYAANAQVTINIDANERGPMVSPTHYGIFFEDINHAADGGLYAELIRNRSFEDDSMPGNRRDGKQESAVSNWYKVGLAKIKLTTEDMINEAQHHALDVTLFKAGDGVRNEGFWGINAVKGRKYRLSFFAKSDERFNGKVTVKLQKKDGRDLGSTTIKVGFGKKWKKYTAEITATGNDPKAEFVLTGEKAGHFLLDVVSLFPPTFKDRENGMRPDLAQMLADMKPRFMRFPGGCFVEGQQSPDNAFRWKRTIGPIEEREGHANVNWGYRTSDGIGFHEYLQLAEDLGAKPLFVVNVGIWHGGCTPYDQIDEWIEECLDALEYANGDVKTKYGKMRAEAGHPEPFNLEYIEIGNENYNFHMDNNSDQSDHYPERYYAFYKAIKEKYPNVHCIGNVESWGTDEPSWRNDYPVDMVDEHYYRNPKWFADRFHKYDTYRRDSHKVYVGEYAVTSQFGDLGNLNAALGEAVYMMGMENNSDVVVMNSYAPIFVNENDAKWRPDMIRFNSHKVMGTPSYYVQQLFPNNIGTQVVKTDLDYKLTIPSDQAGDKIAQSTMVGLATYRTTVRYRNPELTFYDKQRSIDDFTKWRPLSGTWNVEGKELVQTSDEAPAMIVAPVDFHSDKYTFKVQAKKENGAEGFMPVFHFNDKNNFVWYNVGGWSNVQSNVEQSIGGGRSTLAANKRFTVETGRWYDLKVDVENDSIKCYIDGQLDFACKLQKGSNMEGVYASTTIDDATKTMYVKVVNVGEGYADGTVNLKNCSVDMSANSAVSLTRLSSFDGNDENTLDQPRYIYPTVADIKAKSPSQLSFHVPAFSVNIIKIKLK